eukprot:3932059-Amphidinium_carterae.1
MEQSSFLQAVHKEGKQGVQTSQGVVVAVRGLVFRESWACRRCAILGKSVAASFVGLGGSTWCKVNAVRMRMTQCLAQAETQWYDLNDASIANYEDSRLRAVRALAHSCQPCHAEPDHSKKNPRPYD